MKHTVMKRRPSALLLTAVMLFTAAAYLLYTSRSTDRAVTLPVAAVSGSTLSPAAQYRLRRDETEQRDMAALELLCAQPDLDEALRTDAASALQTLIDVRQRQLALEGALTNSGISDCVAVLTGNDLTIVTSLQALTPLQNALLIELAQTHAAIDADHLRVVCTGE